MKEKGIRLVRLTKWLITAILGIGIIVIAVFPFDNRSLRLQFTSEDGKYEIIKYSDEIADNQLPTIIFDQVNDIKIKNVRMYGKIKTIYLEKIGYGQFAGYIASVENGEMQQEDDGIHLISDESGQIKLVMNESFGELLIKHSSSVLLERIILAGLLGTIIALI